jgi:hypothetical protein
MLAGEDDVDVQDEDNIPESRLGASEALLRRLRWSQL